MLAYVLGPIHVVHLSVLIVTVIIFLATLFLSAMISPLCQQNVLWDTVSQLDNVSPSTARGRIDSVVRWTVEDECLQAKPEDEREGRQIRQ